MVEPLTHEQTEAKKEAIAQSHATNANVSLAVPPGLDYLPYQKAGIAFGLSRNGVLIADEMGLGKTVESIGIVNNDKTARKILVVCPASLKINWKREFDKWNTKGLSVGIADGKTFPTTDVVVINYDVLKKHHDVIRKQKWDMLITDECHYLKNPKALRTGEVLGNDKVDGIKAEKRVFMTGTPIANRPAELWPLVHSLDPDGLGKSWKAFHVRYAQGKETRFGWDISGASNLDELQQRLRSSIMIRRLKSEVLKELPPKTRQVIELPVDDPAVKRAVDAERKAFANKERHLLSLQAKADLAKASGNEGAYADAVGKLKEAADVAFSEISKMRHDVALAKVPQVIEHVKEMLENTDKIIVFAHHHDVVDKLKEAFGNEAVEVTGNTPMQSRQDAVDRFQQEDGCKVFIGNIRAAGVGLTLTAASTVVFAELDWTPGNVTQAEDRAHRIGQVNNVLIQHLVLDGSLDAKMAKTLVKKQRNIDYALDKNGKPVEDGTESNDIVLPLDIPDDTIPVAVGVGQNTKPESSLTPEQVSAIHEGLQHLAFLDPDKALEQNGVGFNAYDGMVGHSLAQSDNLTPRQAALGLKLIHKYRGQLGDALVNRAKGEIKKAIRVVVTFRNSCLN